MSKKEKEGLPLLGNEARRKEKIFRLLLLLSPLISLKKLSAEVAGFAK